MRTLWLSALAIAVPAGLSYAQAAGGPQPRPYTVLTVHWSTEDFPSNPVVDAAIRQVLRSQPDLRVDYYAEYLESDRFPAGLAATALRDYIRRKYRGRQIDLVFAVSDPALQFVQRYRRELFPRAAVVFTGTTAPSAAVRREGAGVTGIVNGVAYGETLKLALALHPGTEKVFVVARAPAPGFLEEVREELGPSLHQGVELVYLDEPSISRLTDALKAAPPRSLVLYIRYSLEEPGRVVFPDEAARTVTAASPVPVYGIHGRYIGLGIVGGAIREPSVLGARAAEIALQILRGTPAQAIPVENVRLVPTFDWRQLRRWKIAESRLPPASSVQFREPTAWELYRWYIVAAVSLMAFQALLIGGLLAQRSRRHRAEEVTRTSEVALRSSYERIRQMAGRFINAQEAARTRIACDLHDDVCQELAGLSIELSRLKRWQRNLQDTTTQDALSALQRRALGLVERVRRLSHDLHPGTLRHVGFAGAMEAHCVEVEERYDVQVTFTADGDLGGISDDAALCLFRIAQEAMRNAATHGLARRLTLAATRSQTSVELTITDDGTGFDLEAARANVAGLGLVSMEERAHLIGGQVEIVTRPRGGTTVRVTVPIEATAAERTPDAAADVYAAALPRGPFGARHESQSPDRRRPQAVCRGYRPAAQGSLRDCRHRRRRQPAGRGGPQPAPRRGVA